MQSSDVEASGQDQVDEPEILPVQMGFDYSTLPAEIRAEAKTAADEIKSSIRRSVMDVGAALSRIKNQLPHGQFGKWLSAEFGLSERTAQNYMNAAALASKSETVSVLRPKTLYLLSSPSTPDSIRQKVIEQFDAGQPIPDRAIRAMVHQAKVHQQEKPRRTQLRRDPGSAPQSPTPQPPIEPAEQAVRFIAAMPEDERVTFLAHRIKELPMGARAKLLGIDAFAEVLVAKVREVQQRKEKNGEATTDAKVKRQARPDIAADEPQPEQPTGSTRTITSTDAVADVPLVAAYQAIPDLEFIDGSC
jgi:hypothetical protein